MITIHHSPFTMFFPIKFIFKFRFFYSSNCFETSENSFLLQIKTNVTISLVYQSHCAMPAHLHYLHLKCLKRTSKSNGFEWVLLCCGILFLFSFIFILSIDSHANVKCSVYTPLMGISWGEHFFISQNPWSLVPPHQHFSFISFRLPATFT